MELQMAGRCGQYVCSAERVSFIWQQSQDYSFSHNMYIYYNTTPVILKQAHYSL